MSSVRGIAKNMGVLLISQIISYILGFFYFIYMARYLGAEGFGILSFALAFTGILGILLDLGLNSLMVREIAKDYSLREKYLGNISIIKLILSFVTLIIIIISINLLNYSHLVINVVYLIGLYIIFNTFTLMFYSIFQAYEKLEYRSIGDILNSVLMFLGVIIAIYLGANVFGFALIYALVGLITLLYSFLICIIKFPIKNFDIDLDFWKDIFKIGIPISIALIFASVTFKVDTIILSIIKGNIEVGFYNASYKFIEILLFIPLVFTSPVYPLFSKYYVSSRESFKLMFKKSIKYLSIIGIPIAIGTPLIAEKLILFTYGYGFLNSVIALQILIWAIPFLFLDYIFTIILITVNKQKLLMKITFICLIFNILTNIIFIPFFGFLAASIITVLTEIIYSFIAYYYISKLIYKIKDYNLILKPVIASSIMFLIIYFFNLNLILSIIIASIVYFISLFIIKGLDEEDINFLRRIFNGK